MKRLEEDRITLKYLLEGDGHGYIYDCDITRWLGVKLPSDKRDELKEKLKCLKS